MTKTVTRYVVEAYSRSYGKFVEEGVCMTQRAADGFASELASRGGRARAVTVPLELARQMGWAS